MKKIENDQIQESILKVLVWFDKFCRKNNLKYALCGGTCLGAIRHKGFIPWDNDADVIMERGEYEKFLKLMEKEDGQFKIMHSKNTENYFYPFAKLCDTNTVLFENEYLYPIKDLGVYIDVFPVDGVPNDEKDRQKFLKKVRKNHSLCVSTIFRAKSKFQTFFVKLWGKTFNKKKQLEKFEKLCKTHRVENSDQIGWICWANKFTFPRRCLEDLIEWDFEGHKMFVPKDYDTVLKAQYGDYMTLPPVEKRIPHNVDAYTKEEQKTNKTESEKIQKSEPKAKKVNKTEQKTKNSNKSESKAKNAKKTEIKTKNESKTTKAEPKTKKTQQNNKTSKKTSNKK